MSISRSLSIANSGLAANARLAEVVSANIANALTEGYARRQVSLASSPVDGGVRVNGTMRLIDISLIGDRRAAQSGLAHQRTLMSGLARLETVLGAAGSGTGISDRIVALEQTLAETGADPSSDIRLGQVLSRLNDVVSGLHAGQRTITQLRQEADAGIAAGVDDLNRMLTRLEGINQQVRRTHGSSTDQSGLMDERQVLIDRIADLVPVREIPREGGTIALMTTGGLILLDGTAASIAFSASPVIEPDMSLAGGVLSGLTVNGRPMVPGDGGARFAGGSLAAGFDLRDVRLPAAQEELDALARDLILRFQDPAVDPSLAPGDGGLLTESGGPLNLLGGEGLAGRLRINAAVDPAQGGALWRLRDGVGASTPGPVGDARQIDAWIAALERPQALVTGGRTGGAATLAARMESGLGTVRRDVERDVSYSNARLTGLREAELAQGVDSDHEMQMLLRIEQAYAANARVIQAVDEMMRLLMEI